MERGVGVGARGGTSQGGGGGPHVPVIIRRTNVALLMAMHASGPPTILRTADAYRIACSLQSSLGVALALISCHFRSMGPVQNAQEQWNGAGVNFLQRLCNDLEKPFLAGVTRGGGGSVARG